MRSKFLGSTLILLVAGVAFGQEWPQWALNAQHTGQASVVGQNLNRNIVNIVEVSRVHGESQLRLETRYGLTYSLTLPSRSVPTLYERVKPQL